MAQLEDSGEAGHRWARYNVYTTHKA